VAGAKEIAFLTKQLMPEAVEDLEDILKEAISGSARNSRGEEGDGDGDTLLLPSNP